MRKSIYLFVLVSMFGALVGGYLAGGAAGAEPAHVLTIDDVTVTEGNGNLPTVAMVSVHVDPAPALGEQIHVDFGTSAQAAQGATATTTAPGDETPTFPEDFAQADGTVTFPTGVTQQLVTLSVLGDNADEGDETFFVKLFNARKECLVVCTDGASIADDSATVTISDDDDAPTLVINDVSHDEGDGPEATTYEFTVTKTGGSAEDVTVDYATADITATSPEDYESGSGTLTFEPSSPSSPETQSISVSVVGDTNFEPGEAFKVLLGNAGNATIADGEGLGGISNDDAPPPPSMTVADAGADEGDAIQFKVTLSSPPGPGQTAKVDWALEGTEGEGKATEGLDYDTASGSLLYSAGENEQTVAVPTTSDEVNELDEVFTLRLTKPEGSGTGGYSYNIANDTAIGTIVNDDAEPTLAIDDVIVDAEGASQVTTTATFTVTKEGLTDRAVGVDYATTDGTAASGDDYVGGLGELTFAPEETEKQITVEVIGDGVHEADETFVVALENAVNATIADVQGVATITDDDAAPVIAISDAEVTEGNSGLKTMSFKVTKVGATALTASVAFGTADGMARSGLDYNGRTGSLIFTPTQTQKALTVSVRGDVLDEWNETFNLNLSAPENATTGDAQGIGRILDDDAAPSMSINDGKVNESSTSACALTVRLGAPSGRAISVHYATVSGTAGTSDYVAKSGDLTFARGETAKQIKVFARGDTLVEGTERFAVKLSGISPSGGATFSDSTGKCFIVDND